MENSHSKSTTKRRYELIEPEFLAVLADVMTWGLTKYPKDNWKHVDLNHMGSILRHIEAHRNGQILDPESGLPHLAHATARIMMLYVYTKNSSV
jgi:Domain of unknown function (DUF5664)